MSRKRRFILFITLLLWLAMLFSQALAQEEEEKVASPEVRLTVTGKLAHVKAIGGETSGWAVILDKPRQLGGNMLKRLELDPAGRKLEKFGDKHLEITGILQTRTGVERGRYRVLLVKNILVLN
ncbi:MAG: hypothetical protein M1438_00995 [Deltaproteobacteria bacterium]|nr:hypothetical protein [Deltaproteobacteria bacterium]